MSESSPFRPVPGPPRPGPLSPGQPPVAPEPSSPSEDRPGDADGERFTDLEQQPVAEHVAVFEDEHARLQHELSTIDRL